MKTLKKTLCLVLAMVMVFGLCTISASAKLDSYSDKDAIKYEEAVDVLTGIGILQGSGGAFRPQATITRAEAAKIIAYLVIGDSKQADALKASSDPFTDVSADYWAAGYIAYCASVGIIKGMGDGSYHPLDNVKGLQFATMLLRALGYGKDGEFEGSDWSINASKWALSLKLFDGNLAGASATEDATREECALYAFNTLGIKKVTYSALLGGYTTTTSALGNAASSNMEETFADDFKLKSKPADEDAFGRPTGSYWYINSGKREAITATYGADKNLKEVYTAEVTGGDIWNLLGKDALAKADIQVIKDGEDVTDEVTKAEPEEGEGGDEEENDEEATKPEELWNSDNLVRGAKDTLAGTGKGIETYVYAWTDKEDDKDVNHVKVCIVNTYLAQISEVIDATAKDDRKVKISDLYDKNVAATDEPEPYVTEDFKEDDYVLVTIAQNSDSGKYEIQSMVPAEVIKDEVTRFTQDGSKKSIVVKGKTYTPAANACVPGSGVSGKDISKTLVDGEDHEIYVLGDYVIGVANIAAESDYVYVADVGVLTDNSGKIKDNKVVKAEIYYADGKSEVVTVKDGAGDIDELKEDSTTADYNVEGLYELTWDGSKAVLSRPGNDDDDTFNDSVSANVSKNITKAGDYTLTGKTVFFYIGRNDKNEITSVTTYTGIGNVPRDKDGKNAPVAELIADEASKALAVAVDDKVEADDGDIVFYFEGTKEDKGNYEVDNSGKTVTYYVYEPGTTETKPIKVTYATKEDAKKAVTEVEPGFYFQKGNKLEKVTDAKGGVTYATEVELTAATSTSVTFGGKEYDFKDHGTFVNLSDETIANFGKLEGAVKDLDVGSAFLIAVSYKDGQINDLYVTSVKKAETPEVEP